MDVMDAIRALGGAARWTQLREHVTQRQLQAALDNGKIRRVGRGLYSVNYPDAHAIAIRYNGVVSHHSAAYIHNMGALERREVTDVSVGRHRGRLAPNEKVKFHYHDVPPKDVGDNRTTSPLRTAVDCAQLYPISVALPIVEAALRDHGVAKTQLVERAADLRGPGARRARMTIAKAEIAADSAMESRTRAILLEVGITCFVPQFEVALDHGRIYVDLGDPKTGTLIEADSFEWHGSREDLERDARRYDELVSLGYAVLRFSWEHVVHDQEWVVEIVKRTLELRRR